MQIDRKTMDALSSDTRINILKSLAKRRKTITELSRELNLAKSTISEHIDKLEESRLVIKKDTGKKWIYYELSSKGEKIIKPKTPTPFIILLTLGIIIVIFGSMNLTIITLEPYQYQVTETITKTIPSEQVTTGTETVTGIIENKTIEENITRTETSYKEISQIKILN